MSRERDIYPVFCCQFLPRFLPGESLRFIVSAETWLGHGITSFPHDLWANVCQETTWGRNSLLSSWSWALLTWKAWCCLYLGRLGSRDVTGTTGLPPSQRPIPLGGPHIRKVPFLPTRLPVAGDQVFKHEPMGDAYISDITPSPSLHLPIFRGHLGFSWTFNFLINAQFGCHINFSSGRFGWNRSNLVELASLRTYTFLFVVLVCISSP